MCGRFAFHSPHDTVVALFALPADTPPVAPRYNITPASEVAAVRVNAGGARELAWFHWGLVPSWAKERSIGARLVNARAETLAAKPSFRAAFRRRRCLVLADGYYEWHEAPGGKQPYYLHADDSRPFGMAGLWESWSDPASGVLESCVIVTRESAGVAREIHARMPAIIAPGDYVTWLDPANQDVTRLAALLAGEPPVPLSAHAVSRRVNSPRNEGPELTRPLPAGAG